MIRRSWIPLALIAPLLAVLPDVASAEQALRAEVPFNFIASGKPHEPGKYELRVGNDLTSIELVAPDQRTEFELVLSRLAPPAGSSPSRLVFDKVGSTYQLSEMWIAGEEGFLLHSTKEKHTRHKVPLQRAGK